MRRRRLYRDGGRPLREPTGAVRHFSAITSIAAASAPSDAAGTPIRSETPGTRARQHAGEVGRPGEVVPAMQPISAVTPGYPFNCRPGRVSPAFLA